MKYFASLVALFTIYSSNAFATPVPGPEVETGVLGMTAVGVLLYFMNRRKRNNPPS